MVPQFCSIIVRVIQSYIARFSSQEVQRKAWLTQSHGSLIAGRKSCALVRERLWWTLLSICILGVDDAVIYLMQQAHLHLDGGGSTVIITFFDFSSAFDTIQPLLLGEKLRVMGVDTSIVSWITDYLTGRPQFVRTGSVLSDVVVSDTGAPQGTVLSPFLFTLYTTDFQYNTGSCHLQKSSDDLAVVGCISEGQEEEYWALVDNFVEWTGQNHLWLNISKTREMVIEFKEEEEDSSPTTVHSGKGCGGSGGL